MNIAPPLFTRVWLRNFWVWKKHVRASLIGNLGQPFLFLIAMGYGLGRSVPEIHGMTYLQFIAPGLVASSVMYSAAFEATYGSYTRLATQKTFDAILMTPVSVYDLALGEIVWGATKGLISGLIMLAAIPFFGITPSLWTIPLIPLLFLEGLTFASLGIIMTARAPNYEFFNYFTSLLITPLFLFSGIFFPIESLGTLARAVMDLLPLTGAVEVSRALCYGRPHEISLFQIGVLVSYTISTTIVASILMKKRLIR